MASIVKSIEKLTINLGTGDLTGTGALTKSQTAADCVPFTTVTTTRDANESFDERLITVTISGSTVTCTRKASTGSVVVECVVFVVEFDSAVVTVQTGSFDEAGLTVDKAPSTNFTDIAKTFLYFTFSTTNIGDDYTSAMVSGTIVSTSVIRFERDDENSSMSGQWYTVECANTEFLVRRGSIAMFGSNATKTATITAVVLARSMVIASYRSGELDDDPRDGAVIIDLTNTTTVTATRSNGGTPSAKADIEFQVVQFEADQLNSDIQRGQFTVLAANSSDTDIITAIDQAKAIANSPHGLGSCMMDSIDGDDIGAQYGKFDFDSDTVVSVNKVDTNASVNQVFEWEVIEFAFTIPSVTKGQGVNGVIG